MRALKMIALLIVAALLTGCTQGRQIESIAFAVILGADLTDGENLELTVQIPQIGGADGESQGDDGGTSTSDYLIASARGATFADALMALEINVPRDLSLTQVKLLVVSDSLARHEKFYNFAESLARLDQSCASAYLAVCQGSAKEFVKKQEPVIGMRVSLGILSMFEHHRTRGYITGANFADFYYQGVSVGSDPVAILCATSEEAEDEPLSDSALEEMTPSTVPAESTNKNDYVGTALFRNARMVGTLDGLETSLVNAVRGAPVFFGYSLDGMPVSLQSHGMRALSIDVGPSGALRISFRLDFNVIADIESPPVGVLEARLEQDMLELLNRCQALGVEPFGFADHALKKTLSLAEWERFNWSERFSQAEFDVDVHITVTEA